MKKLFRLTCTYCNHIWDINYHSQEEIRCPKCNDRNIKAEDLREGKIDYYVGSPPFPDENKDDRTWHGD